MIRRLIFKLNDMLTRPKLTHVSSDGKLYFTVASPDKFYNASNLYRYNIFEMACLQSYLQSSNGRWYRGLVFSFENNAKMKESGILPAKSILRDS